MTIEEAKQSFLAKLNSGALTPVVNSANQAPPSTQPPSYPAAPNSFLRTPLPSVAVLQPDMARQFFNPATPQFRSMPPTPSSNPAVGAAVLSNAPASITNINTGSGMVYKGIWASYAVYSINNVVLYNNSAYIAIQKSIGLEPDLAANSTAWTLLAKNLNFRGQWSNLITPVQSHTGTASAISTTIAFTNPVVKGNWLFVFLNAYILTSAPSNSFSVTDNLGNTYVKLIDQQESTSVTVEGAWFVCKGSALGGACTATITGTYAGGAGVSLELGCAEYLGSLFAATDGSLSSTGTTGFGGTLSVSYTPSQEDIVLLFAAFGNLSNGAIYSYVPVAATTQVAAGGTNSGNNLAVLAAVSGTPVTTTFSFTSSVPLTSNGGILAVQGFTPSAAYQTVAKYHPADVVEYRGSTYICIVPTNTDPVSGINTSWVSVAQGPGFSDVINTSYTAIGTDDGNQLNFDITSAKTLTLPATPPNSGWWITAQNHPASTAVLTVSPNSLKLDGSTSSIALTPGQGVSIYTDGMNYYTLRPWVSLGGITQFTSGGTYTALPSDNGKLIVFSSNGGTVDLPSTPPSSTWTVEIQAVGVGVTVSPNGKNLDGSSSSISLSANMGVTIFTDGTNYFTMRGMSPVIGGVLSKTNNYGAAVGDSGNLITFNKATAVTLSLMGAGGPVNRWFIFVENTGVGNLTVSPNGLTLDGSSSSLVLTTNQGVYITSDGTNYFTMRGVGGGGGGGGVNAQTGTTYTVLSTDLGKLITFINASAIAVTLPIASTSGFGASWYTDVQNIGAVGSDGVVTITPTTSTIDGAAILIVQPNSGCRIFSDGTNYFTNRGAAGQILDDLTDAAVARSSQFFRPAQFTTDVSIDNSNFQASAYMTNNGTPPGWYQSTGSGGISYDTSTQFIGARSLVITGNSIGIANCRVISVLPGETYQVSGWIKTDGSGVAANIELVITNNPITHVRLTVTASTTASTWTYVTAVGTVPTAGGSNDGCLGIIQLISSGGSGSCVCEFGSILLHRIFGASGTYSSPGMVPDPGATAGTARFLREDASWQNPTFSGTDITLAAIDLTGQTSSISATNFANTGTGLAAGMYIAQIFVDVTTAGSAGTLTTTIAYTTDSGSDSQTTATTSLATLGTNSGFTIPFYAAANSAISYATTVASVVGSPVYTLHIRLIQVATTATLYAAGGVNSQTANYLAVAGDMGKLITMNGSSLTLTLPATPPSSLWWCSVENTNASSLTLSPNSLDIDGSASSITLAQNTGLVVFTDGTNYFTMRGIGGGGGGGGSITTEDISTPTLSDISSVTTLKISQGLRPDTVVQQTASAIVQHTSVAVTTSSSQTLAFVSNVTFQNLLVVCATWNSSSITCNVTDTMGNSYFPATKQATNGSQSAQIWYARALKTGACTPKFTFSSSVSGDVYIHEYPNLDFLNPLDVNGAGTGSTSTAPTSGNVTTNFNYELIFGFAYCSGGTGAAGAGFTARETLGGNCTEDQVVSSAGAIAATFTSASSTYIALVAAFKLTWTGTSNTGTSRIVIPAYSPLDIPPVQPSPWDDEFDSQTLNAKWTVANASSLPIEWDINTSLPSCIQARVPSSAAVPTANGILLLSQTVSLPPVFSATAKFSIGIPTTAYQMCGLVFGDTAAFTTNSVLIYGGYTGSAYALMWDKTVAGTVTGQVSAASPTCGVNMGVLYIHVQRMQDGLWYAWFSYDGMSWVKSLTGLNPTSTFFPTISYIGVELRPYINSGAQPAFRQACDWVRYNFLWLQP